MARRPGSIASGYHTWTSLVIILNLQGCKTFCNRDAGYKYFMMSMPSHERPRPAPHQPSELAVKLKACRKAFVAIGLYFGMSKILMLNGVLLMLAGVDVLVLQNHLQQLS
jgi:hypothetical protein